MFIILHIVKNIKEKFLIITEKIQISPVIIFHPLFIRKSMS